MAFFYKGNTYKVWERKGLAPNKKGMLSISENSFEKGEVLPEMELTYKGKVDGQHVCLMPNGTEVVVHRNHFDASTPYNVGKIQNRTKAKSGVSVRTSTAGRSGALPRNPSVADRAEELAQRIAEELSEYAEEVRAATGDIEEAPSEPSAEATESPDADLEAELDQAAG